MKTGKVYLVGAGPGDIGLATLKAVVTLKMADVVIYDHLINPELLAFARKGVEVVFAGKFPQHHVLFQKEINRLLVKKAREGKIVVRLKGGDPLLFGRGAEEALALRKARIPFEIVPGVSSSYAVPAYAGIPVTCRGISSRLNIVTGHETPDKKIETIPWKKLLDKQATLVVLMGMANLERIVKAIGQSRQALSTPVAVISNGTMSGQAVVAGNVSNIVSRVKAAAIKAPAVIVFGDVVRLRRRISWFIPTAPLQNKRVLVVRPAHQTSELARLLKRYGAKVIALPLIKIVPKSRVEIDKKMESLHNYDWFIFTSVNGVDLFTKALKRKGMRSAQLKGKKFAAIGEKTAERLRQGGFSVDLIPKQFVQESLADSLIKGIRNKSARLILFHAEGSRPVLEERLRKAKYNIDSVMLYRAEAVQENQRRVRQLFADRKVDAVILTSSSCVESFASVFPKAQIKRLTKDVVTALIGPISAKTARKVGLTVNVESRSHTIEGVTDALVAYYTAKQNKL